MQALKAASQPTEASFTPTDHPSLYPVPPKGTPAQSPSHPQEVTPAKHTPSAEQVAILALTSSSKAAAKEAAVISQQEQQLQQQLQEQLPQQQPLHMLLGNNDANCSAAETGQQVMQDDSLTVVHRQLSEEFKDGESVAQSVSEEAQSEQDSIEVCTCIHFLSVPNQLPFKLSTWGKNPQVCRHLRLLSTPQRHIQQVKFAVSNIVDARLCFTPFLAK